MNAKQQKIKEAYGDVYDWDENGWLTYGCDEANEFGYEPFGEYETRNYIDGVYEWRPLSLQGIENNNGWICIESENDLPIDGQYHVISKEDDYVIGSLNKELKEVKKYWLENFTNYQPIIKPEPPIY